MAGVSSFNVLIFTQQFASMIRSNLQLVDVLHNLADETPQKKLREVIADVADDVTHGTDLSAAMAQHPQVFDDVYVNVVKSGLESGRLGEALLQISHYQKVIHETGRKVMAAMTYPAFIIFAFFGIFNAMIFFILPRFSAVYSNFGKKLPEATQILLNVGKFWSDNWHLIIGAQVVVISVLSVWIATGEGRALWDQIKLKLPLLGTLYRMSALARFLRTLAVQVENDVPVLQALCLAADACGNVYIREILYDIADDVERGRGLAASFRDHEIFHGIVLQMLASGEEAGILDELLMSSADYFDSLVQDLLDRITALINPILTMVVGLLIAGMMVAVFLPVFQMGSMVK